MTKRRGAQELNDSSRSPATTESQIQPIDIITVRNPIPIISGESATQNSQICSTWGNYHFKTFDGDVFQVSSNCNFVLSSLCKGDYADFNIQVRRRVVDGLPTISKVTMKLDGTVVTRAKGSIRVYNKEVKLPFFRFGVNIISADPYIKISAKLGVTATWIQDDSFLLELDKKFKNQTCGLCGDFNGALEYNEFYEDDAKLSVVDYANIWRMDSPTEDCEDPELLPQKSCRTAELTYHVDLSWRNGMFLEYGASRTLTQKNDTIFWAEGIQRL